MNQETKLQVDFCTQLLKELLLKMKTIKYIQKARIVNKHIPI